MANINITKISCESCDSKNATKYLFGFTDKKYIEVYLCKNCLKILRDKINKEIGE